MNGYPWFKCRREPWHELISKAEKPLSNSVALQDLEALESAKVQPTKAELCRRWGWSRARVRWLLGGLETTTTPQPHHNHTTTTIRKTARTTSEPTEANNHTAANEQPTSNHLTTLRDKELEIDNNKRQSKAQFDRAASLWREHKPRGPKLIRSKGGGKLIASRIKDHGIDAVIDVLSWALTSDHRQALWLRENGYCRVATLCNASKFEGYLESAQNAQPTKQRGEWTDYDDEPSKTPF